MFKRVIIVITYLSILPLSTFAQDLIWENSIEIDSTLSTVVQDIKQDENNNILILSRHIGNDIAYQFMSLSKFSQTGDFIWRRIIKLGRPIFPKYMDINDSGEIECISLLAKGAGIGWYAIFRPYIARFNANGEITYEHVDTLSSIKSSIYDFGLIFKDQKDIFNHIVYIEKELYCKKYDINGNFESEAFIDTIFQPIGLPQISDLLVLNDSTYIILGSGRNMEYGKTNIFVSKYSNNKLVWHNFYSADSTCISRKIFRNNSSYTVLGRVKQVPFLRTIADDGKLENQIYFDGLPDKDVILQQNNSYLFSGAKPEEGSYKASFHIASTDVDSQIQWELIWGNKNDFNLLDKTIQLDDGNFITAGSSNKSVYIAKIKNPITAIEYANDRSNFNLFPNPFSETTTISYSLPQANRVTITIFDALGNEIAIPVNEYVPAGEHKTQFNGTYLPSGIYYYSIRIGSGTRTGKMILVK